MINFQFSPDRHMKTHPDTSVKAAQVKLPDKPKPDEQSFELKFRNAGVCCVVSRAESTLCTTLATFLFSAVLKMLV